MFTVNDNILIPVLVYGLGYLDNPLTYLCYLVFTKLKNIKLLITRDIEFSFKVSSRFDYI